MGRNFVDGVEEAWINSVRKYPPRFGRLCGLFYNLLDEANISDERKLFYKEALRGIDTPAASGDNHPSGVTTDK